METLHFSSDFEAMFGGISKLVAVALFAFFISLIICVIVMKLSQKFYFFIDKADSDKPQRFHTFGTPRAGGIGIFAVFVLIFVFFVREPWSLYLLAGISAIFISGILEDISISVSPKIRLFLQVLGTAIAILPTGIIITDLSPIVLLPYSIGVVFSIFGIVGVCNSMNIIDGFNGLAAGICLMVLGAIFVGAWINEMNFVLFVAALLFGSVAGFFVLNFPTGKIFLGDGGAYMLGFLIAILLGILTQQGEKISAWFGLSVMIYPIWEVIFSIFRKLASNFSAMQPDDKHFHMFVFRKFKSNALTSVFMWFLNLPFVIFSVAFMNSAHVLIVLSVIFIIIYTLMYYVFKAQVQEI